MDFIAYEISGGVIGSNLPDYPTFGKFKESQIGFWGLPIFDYDTWARIEHAAFWLGLILAAAIYLTSSPASHP